MRKGLGALALLFLLGQPARAASTGQTALLTPQGSGAATANGDYITGGLDTLYSYFIEVPPGLGRLTVEIFDADVGRGAAAEAGAGRDRARGGFNTQANYTLIRPDGTTAATLNGCDDANCNDNAWTAILNSTTAQNTAAGHWELQVDMRSTVTGGDDINAIGIRAHDGTSGAGGTELPIYYDSQTNVGVNPPGSGTVGRSYDFFPYITSGCSASKNDFDFDSNNGNTGSIALTSRDGGFSQNFASTALSADDVWRRDSFSGWTSDQLSTGYGIWDENRTINSYLVNGTPNGNYANVWYANFSAAANPPAANPTTNAFRVYFLTDAGTTPVKPYLEQLLTFKSGTLPVPVGQTGIFQVTVRLVNPTTRPIVFSAANLVTANVPGAGATYNGNAAVSQGTITAQPAVNGTGNVTWNPGTVAAGTTQLLTYQVRVSPTSAGQRIVVTATPASGNGTRARYVDETGNTVQTRATFTFGPICELATTQGLLTAAVVGAVATHPSEHGGIEAEWETSSEAGTAGFYLYRWDGAAERYQRVNERLLASLQGSPQGGHYRLVDPDADPRVPQRYVVEEVEAGGARRRYGPFRTLASERPDGIPAQEPASRGLDGFTALASAKDSAPLGRLDRAEARKGVATPGSPVQVVAGASGAIHLSVREPGLYRISSAEVAGWFGLAEKAASSLIGSGKLALSQGGAPVAWYPDVRFEGDKSPTGLVFYGEATGSPFSDLTVYKLERGKGIVMTSVAATPAAATTGGTFAESRHSEVDSFAATSLPLEPQSDYWFWQFLQGDDASFGRRSFSLDAPGLAAGAAALHVRLQGATASGVAGEHRAVVSLNGATLGELGWQGIEPQEGTFSIPAGALKASGNTVDVEAHVGGGAPYSITYVDSFDLAYRRTLQAAGNELTFGVDGAAAPLTVSGFQRGDLRAIDLRDPRQPRWLSGLTIESDGAGYRTRFVGAAGGRYLIAATGGLKQVASARAWSEPTLKAPGKRAAYLVVAPSEWRAPAEALAALRRSQGLEAEVVDLDQIADEFAAGASDPNALRSFLSWAYANWPVPPRYVALAGSGTVDYRDLLGLHDNVVPPLMVKTAEGLFPSDGRLGDFDGDGVPEIAVGRIPAASPAALSAYIAKLAAFEAAPKGGAGRILMLSDTGDRGADFAAQSVEVGSQVAATYQVDQLSLAQVPLGSARAQALAAFSDGTPWINYLGHGGLDRLSAGGLLVNDDAAGLTNSTRLPILTAMTCTVNRFAVPGVPALGELLVNRSGGGAIAVWGPTGLSVHAEAKLLAQRLYHTTSGDESLRLGDRILRAEAEFKALGGDAALLPLYALLGDPALRVPAPPTPPSAGVRPSDE